VALLREDPEFQTALARGASALGESLAFVEKDYWVTQVLRALHEGERGGFVLKGGTSLSKGYDLINRFSEDVDVLVVPQAGETIRASEQRLRGVTELVADQLGLPWSESRPPGRGRHPHRGDYIKYGDESMETRIGDGQEPSQMVTVAPTIARWDGVAGGSYADLAPFRVRALEPRRTLIEKLVAVHHAMSRWTPESPPNQRRFGRHYHDIFKLLDHQATLKALEDRVRFGHILRDVELISQEFYDGYTPRPDGGFATSAAFRPPRPSPMRTWLEESYVISLDLLSPSEPRPGLGQVLQRVDERAALL
jgi:predicted nucleotidyltransferase component of viral defense system